MSTPSFIYFLAILAIGVPAALRVTGLKVRVRNATALAMVGTWLFGRAVYAATGVAMPLQAMVLSDAVVIAAMFVKEDWVCCEYRNTPHQLACLWIERTPWDRGILGLFPVVWLFYAPIVGAALQFWVLWSLSLAQLMLAGWEGFHMRRGLSANKSRAEVPERPPPRLFASVREGIYG